MPIIMKLFVVVFFFSLCVFFPLISAKHTTNVRYCSEKNYEVKVIGVDIIPFPVLRGKNTTFSLTATTDKNLSGGKLVIDVKYYGIDFYSETHDLCSKTSCPISAGNFVISHSQELPSYTPAGDFTLQMTMEDEENHVLSCITFNFSIGSSIRLIAKSMGVPSKLLM